MSRHERSDPDGRETLKLTKWELENLHLPPVTTVTLYEGAAPIQFLRHRLAMMLEKNPWLTSRIVKKSTEDHVTALTYNKIFEPEATIDQHLKVYTSGDVGFSLSMPYEALIKCLLPVQCVRSKPATDKNEPLFKVAVIPIESGQVEHKQVVRLAKTKAN